MQHNVTGLKYFCKTSRLSRVSSYKGSGKYWTSHLNKHGKDVTVGVLGFYTDKQRCFDAAKKFSVDNNVAYSEEWANLIEETGMPGAIMAGEKNTFYGKKHSEESKKLISENKSGKSVNKGAYRSPEHRAKISSALKGRKKPGLSEKLTGRKLSQETIEKLRQKSLAYWAKQRTLEGQL